MKAFAWIPRRGRGELRRETETVKASGGKFEIGHEWCERVVWYRLSPHPAIVLEARWELPE